MNYSGNYEALVYTGNQCFSRSSFNSQNVIENNCNAKSSRARRRHMDDRVRLLDWNPEIHQNGLLSCGYLVCQARGRLGAKIAGYINKLLIIFYECWNNLWILGPESTAKEQLPTYLPWQLYHWEFWRKSPLVVGDNRGGFSLNDENPKISFVKEKKHF